MKKQLGQSIVTRISPAVLFLYDTTRVHKHTRVVYGLRRGSTVPFGLVRFDERVGVSNRRASALHLSHRLSPFWSTDPGKRSNDRARI